MHSVNVLVHDAGVFKLKGVDEPVLVSCVSLADAYHRDRSQEELSTKVEQLSAGSELLSSAEVTIPVLPAGAVGTEEEVLSPHGSSTVAGTQEEKSFKAAYMDVSWAR